MPSPAQISILIFGLSSLVAGLFSLAKPHAALESLDLPLEALPAARGNALAAIAMGIYYTLGAYQNNRAFFLATVPMRLLTTVVFWGQGWRGAALWEGVGSLATGAALLWAGSKKSKRPVA